MASATSRKQPIWCANIGFQHTQKIFKNESSAVKFGTEYAQDIRQESSERNELMKPLTDLLLALAFLSLTSLLGLSKPFFMAFDYALKKRWVKYPKTFSGTKVR